MDKKLETAIVTALVLQIFLLISFLGLMNHGEFIDSLLEKSGSNQRIPTASSESKQLVRYINSVENNPGTGFNQREIEHLKDVQGLVNGAKTYLFLLVISLGVFLAKIARKEKITHVILRACTIGIASICVLVIGLLFFSESFALFHSLFFDDGTYTFDQNEKLIMLYPLEFFQNYLAMAIAVAFSMMILAACLSFLAKKKFLNAGKSQQSRRR